jgi:hypothetical protein
MKTKRLIPVLAATLALACAAAAPAARADVVLNEVNCEGTDFIEVVNTSGAPTDISGWKLTDSALDLPSGDEHLYEFPAATEIPGNGDIVVERPADFGFGISCSDQIRLGDPAGTQVDSTVIGAPGAAGRSWGRYPNAAGPFMETLSTPGAANQPADPDPGEDLAAWLYDPLNVVEIDLDLPQSSIDALAVEPEEYVEAEFSLETTGGSYGPLQVGVRLKGNRFGSFRGLSGKAAFKVKFNEFVGGQRFLGLKGLTLNNMVQDPSMLHETLTYAVHRAAGVPASRTGYAFVRVNGAAYGVYLNVEEVDDIMLPRFFDSTQHLYEGSYGADVTPGSAGLFEVDEGSESDRGDLEQLIAAAAPAADGWPAQVGASLDLAEATQMWAVERYVGQWDSYSSEYDAELLPNNYYLHSDDTGFFSMLPWGADIGWSSRQLFMGPAGGVLFERCQRDIACVLLYRSRLEHLRDTVAGMDLDGLASAAAAMLAPWQQLDPRKEHTMEQISAEVENRVRPFISVRPGDLNAFLATAPQVYVRPEAPPAAAPPETTITAGPRAKSRGPRVTFRFAAVPEAASFECKLDRFPYRPCSSPHRVKPGRGRHRLLVRAVGLDGAVDPGPAAHRFRIAAK